MLEYEIMLLFGAIGEFDAKKASSIFYTVTAARTRYAIMDSLAADYKDGIYKKAWERCEKWLGPLGTKRNHIVHWFQKPHFVVDVYEHGKQLRVIEAKKLINSSKMFAQTHNSLAYGEAEIRQACVDFYVMKNVINKFGFTLFYPGEWPWNDIFLQPITDQNPEAFLQRLNDAGFPSRLSPFDQ